MNKHDNYTSDREHYFLLLASLSIAIANVSASSLLIKMFASVGFMVVMTTQCIRSTPGGRKAEIGLKMSFIIIAIFLQFLAALFFLAKAHLFFDMELIVFADAINRADAFLGVFFVALAGLTLIGCPPFHFGHVDYADGSNLSIAYLFLTNAIIQGASILLEVKSVLLRSGINIDEDGSLLGLMLMVGYIILCFRSLDQSKIRRTTAYIACSSGPLFAMSLLFGGSLLLPKLVFIVVIYAFLSLSIFTMYGSLSFMSPMSHPWQTFEDMSGYGRIKPLPTFTFLVAIASISGLPGTLGYFVKLSLIAPLQESIFFSGSIFLSIVIGAACVMRMFVFSYTKASQQIISDKAKPPLTLIMAALILITLGFFPFIR